MIERAREVETVRKLLHLHPAVGVIGARQVGKTTLARSLLATIKGPLEKRMAHRASRIA